MTLHLLGSVLALCTPHSSTPHPSKLVDPNSVSMVKVPEEIVWCIAWSSNVSA